MIVDVLARPSMSAIAASRPFAVVPPVTFDVAHLVDACRSLATTISLPPSCIHTPTAIDALDKADVSGEQRLLLEKVIGRIRTDGVT